MHKYDLPMNFRGDLLVSYLSQGYVSAISIVAVPLQAAAIGVEGFGFIGLMATLQIWFFLLDFGRVAFLTRKSAKSLNSFGNIIDLRRDLRQSEKWIGAAGFLGAGTLFLISDYLSINWLKTDQISPARTSECIKIIGALIAIRLFGELHRGVLLGQGRIIWLAGFNALTMTLRNLAVIPLIWWFGAENPELIFLKFQLLISIGECMALVAVSNSQLRSVNPSATRFTPLISEKRFAWEMWLAAILWVLVSQLDKILLSKILTLAQFGVFSLVLVLASSVSLIAMPFSTLVPVRLTALGGVKSEEGLLFYFTASRWASISVSTISIVLAMYSYEILLLWTGSPNLAREGEGILFYYALGNAIMTISAFPYYIQFSHGKLDLHLKGSLIFTIALIPILFFSTAAWGMNGAGIAWLTINLIYALLWTPIIHRRQGRKLHYTWLIVEVLPPILGAMAGALLAGLIEPSKNRILLGIWFAGATCLTFSLSFATSYLVKFVRSHHSWQWKNDVK